MQTSWKKKNTLLESFENQREKLQENHMSQRFSFCFNKCSLETVSSRTILRSMLFVMKGGHIIEMACWNEMSVKVLKAELYTKGTRTPVSKLDLVTHAPWIWYSAVENFLLYHAYGTPNSQK